MEFSRDRSTVLLTGSTGFLGHYVLAELLAVRGVRCVVMLRAPLARSTDRLRALLAPLCIDVDQQLRCGMIVPLEADLAEPPRLDSCPPFGAIVHCAASTRFDTAANGEPVLTNVEGTRRLLELATEAGVRDFQLVSTAFVCGRTHAPAIERFISEPSDPHNAYETSKWRAEQLAAAWAAADQARRLTLYRPSVIVGAFESGRATKFDGFYVTARATELLARRYEGADSRARATVPLRIKARPQDRQNIVPVDWVARMIGGIAATRRLHGRVYHLVHPNPPTNALIKRALERHFKLRGGSFVDPRSYPTDGLNEQERMFGEIGRPIEHYVLDNLSFERSNTDEAESVLGIRCREYDEEALRRLIKFAQSVNWGRQRAMGANRQDESTYARYFERFLPRHVAQSRIARATAMSVVIRFVIDETDDRARGAEHEWICRFETGALVEVRRGAGPGGGEDFGYRCTADAFWRAVSGRVHPQELFLSGEAEIFGDAERALKMIMILNAFSREFPCDRGVLEGAQYRRSA